MLRKDQKKDSPIATGSADPEEIAKFNALAEEWWDPNGVFKAAHAFNKVRVAHLSQHLPRLFQRDLDIPKPLSGLKVIDVGCGAGIVTEPLSHLGAEMLGIDAAERNVEIAKWHARLHDAPARYQHGLPEDFADQFGTFDAVLSLEVVEHVADLGAFLKSLANLVRPGGVLIIGTLNRTLSSYVKAIIGAEYVLGWLPRGTHDWKKFVTPKEIDTHLSPYGFNIESNYGVAFNPLTMRWSINKDLSTNYLQFHCKDL